MFFLRVETAGGLPECAEIIDDWLSTETPSRNAAGSDLTEPSLVHTMWYYMWETVLTVFNDIFNLSFFSQFFVPFFSRILFEL